MISVVFFKKKTPSIFTGNFFLYFVFKDLRSIRYNILCIFYYITISKNTTPNTLDAAKKSQLCHVTSSCVICMSQYSALLSRCALTLGLSVLMRESVLDRLETMHQMCPRYHCVAVDFCFIIVNRV